MFLKKKVANNVSSIDSLSKPCPDNNSLRSQENFIKADKANLNLLSENCDGSTETDSDSNEKVPFKKSIKQNGLSETSQSSKSKTVPSSIQNSSRAESSPGDIRNYFKK